MMDIEMQASPDPDLLAVKGANSGRTVFRPYFVEHTMGEKRDTLELALSSFCAVGADKFFQLTMSQLTSPQVGSFQNSGSVDVLLYGQMISLSDSSPAVCLSVDSCNDRKVCLLHEREANERALFVICSIVYAI